MCSVSVGLTGAEVGPVPRGTEALLVITEETLLETLEAETDGTELLGLLDEDAGTVGTVLAMVVEYVQGLDRDISTLIKAFSN